MIIEGFRQFGGKHPVTASLRKVLAHYGVRAPHTGDPLSEELLLGIGGGLGGLYFVFQSAVGPILVLGARHRAESTKPTFFERICTRLEVPCERRESSSPRNAERILLDVLEEAIPAIVRLDLASLPYFVLPKALQRFFGHMAVVYGVDDGEEVAYLSDRSTRPLSLTTEELSWARRAIPSFNNKLLVVHRPERIPDLRPGVLDGIRTSCETMLRPRTPGSGIGAWTKWAQLISHRGSHKGWPRVFRPGLPLYSGLTSVFQFIETWGTGGSAFRGMYSSFLDEAAQILEDPSLHESAADFRSIASVWSSLAKAALPDSVPELRETRELLARKNWLIESEGLEGVPRMLEIAGRLAEIREQMKSDFPLGEIEVDALLATLKDHIVRIREMELRAFTELEIRVGR
jgi:hypothetical protein